MFQFIQARMRYSNAKIALRVVITNITDNRSEGFHIVGILSVLYPRADKVTENASEILVASI